MKNIAIYTRRSIYSEESESITMQIDACKAHFKQEECYFEVFIDEGYSGSNTDRPSFLRMMNKVLNGEIDIVSVYKVDRISRNMVDFINLFDTLQKHNVTLISVTEGADPRTPAGKFVLNILASMAEMERANTIQRVKDNMMTIAKSGRWTGGNPPLGYKSIEIEKDNRKGTYLIIDEQEQKLVLEIYKKYLECESFNETTKYISSGFREISISSIINTLTSPVYVSSSLKVNEYLSRKGYWVLGTPNSKGYLTYGKRPTKNNKKSWNDKSMIIVPSVHEPYVDETTWLKVQQIADKNKKEPRPRESQYSYLNNLVKCGLCGANMFIDLSYVKTDGTKVYSFRCSTRKKDASKCGNGMVAVDRLESDIEDYLLEIGTTDELIKKAINSHKEANPKNDKESINKKIDKNIKAINSLIDKLMLLSNEAAKPITVKIEELTKENNELQLKLLELEKKEAITKNIEKSVSNLKNNIQLFNSLKEADVKIKRKAIRKIFSKILFTKDNDYVEVEFVE